MKWGCTLKRELLFIAASFFVIMSSNAIIINPNLIQEPVGAETPFNGGPATIGAPSSCRWGVVAERRLLNH